MLSSAKLDSSFEFKWFKVDAQVPGIPNKKIGFRFCVEFFPTPASSSQSFHPSMIWRVEFQFLYAGIFL